MASMSFLAGGAVSSDPTPEKIADLDEDELDDTRAKPEILYRPRLEGADGISQETAHRRKRIQPEFQPPDTRKYRSRRIERRSLENRNDHEESTKDLLRESRTAAVVLEPSDDDPLVSKRSRKSSEAEMKNFVEHNSETNVVMQTVGELDDHANASFREFEIRELRRLEKQRKREVDAATTANEQKPVAIAANRMPPEGASIRSDRLDLVSSAESDLLVLGTSLAKLLTTSGLASERGPLLRISSVDDLWGILQSERRQSNSWMRKTLSVSSDRAIEAGGQKQLGAFNRSVLDQIDKVLLDQKRLVNRTRLKRMPIQVFGGDSEANPGIGEYHSEIFDDNDFYQQLIRDVVEVGNQPDWKSTARIRKLGRRAPKEVERKASKGRRLRYHTHEKLVGFLAPTHFEAPAAMNEIVSGLFGDIR
ncbi:hypothetical protein NDN08_001007 [Rhodosorus marinus]|uniref:Apoptosis-antagonizing transcription factor C-terminal domain-containing protein n=1 Tax=Rhodosorus marinus TaxID=101924 RepID=A0AAV8UPK7_9RHOD|nr:hypothetical protein NDN08_001007 [Rhodosorus marinus]